MTTKFLIIACLSFTLVIINSCFPPNTSTGGDLSKGGNDGLGGDLGGGDGTEDDDWLDSDGDGIEDDIETLFGSDPYDSTSIPDPNDVFGDVKAEEGELSLQDVLSMASLGTTAVSALNATGIFEDTPVCYVNNGVGVGEAQDAISLTKTPFTSGSESWTFPTVSTFRRDAFNGESGGYFQIEGGILYLRPTSGGGCLDLFSIKIFVDCINVHVPEPPAELRMMPSPTANYASSIIISGKSIEETPQIVNGTYKRDVSFNCTVEGVDSKQDAVDK